MNDDLLTVPEAMARLKVSRWTLYKLMRSGELASVVVGDRCRRIPRQALDAYIARLIERHEAA
ncbi:helix-turn-helix transcriptional regulator [Thermomonospora catenispora]|uniref:helix-turn-helix transcriptional regulator n=1 Tax=Thermomonospora catenispora TaxID=2493090 RepID=UPI001123A0D1|nr:helix-turn-helix domain-containing protein [Thermomonospora catenispora]TNY38091.1 DNA-binding protein [Thermomonospora catenispora]